MRIILKEVSKYLVEMSGIMYSFATVILKRRERLLLTKDVKDEIHVIANGPSFNKSQQYIDKIQGDVMIVNAGAKALGEKYAFNYCCLADPLYFVEDIDEQTEEQKANEDG